MRVVPSLRDTEEYKRIFIEIVLRKGRFSSPGMSYFYKKKGLLQHLFFDVPLNPNK